MEIKSYKKIGSNLYELTLDNGEKVKLYDEIILKHELLIEKKLDEKKLKQVLKDNEPLDCYFKSLKYIAKKMRTKLELRDYLGKNEFTKSSIDYTSDRLSREGYLSEKIYSEAYINDALNLTLNGPLKIYNSLEKLGISKEYIVSYLNKIELEVWETRIKKVIDKRYKLNKSGVSLFKNKMYKELSLLGYEPEMIRNVLNACTFDTDDTFIKEADKAWKLLGKKYTDKTLELKFKTKMYSKGFSIDEINSYIEKITTEN